MNLDELVRDLHTKMPMATQEDAIAFAHRLVAELAKGQEPVAETHPNNIRKDVGVEHWCREVLLYSGNSPHDWLDGENYRTKLYAAPVIPAGWVMVPDEPTEEMLRAAFVYLEDADFIATGVYAAMLAAAPKGEGK